MGIDLVDVSDVQDSLDEWGERYLARVFTRGERAACTASTGEPRPERLAACLAAKEATLKVLLTRGDEAVPLNQIELLGTSAGGEIGLVGEAAATAGRERIDAISVSVTHERGRALAVAVAKFRSGTQPGNERKR